MTRIYNNSRSSLATTLKVRSNHLSPLKQAKGRADPPFKWTRMLCSESCIRQSISSTTRSYFLKRSWTWVSRTCSMLVNLPHRSRTLMKWAWAHPRDNVGADSAISSWRKLMLKGPLYVRDATSCQTTWWEKSMRIYTSICKSLSFYLSFLFWSGCACFTAESSHLRQLWPFGTTSSQTWTTSLCSRENMKKSYADRNRSMSKMSTWWAWKTSWSTWISWHLRCFKTSGTSS